MNHIFRLVWSKRLNSWVVAAENVRSHCKKSSQVIGAVCLMLMLFAHQAQAELASTTIVPASGKTNAYISANGVPVVNIETANSRGVSHNRYTKFNVEANGAVLNNGNKNQVSRESRLAGQVISNMNLVNEATVILNEVVSNNRSTLAGFTEVLGGKADVILANPYGITCSGCGFFNTDRVTLTTGTPNMGGDGSVSGFSVNRGDVIINGDGLNASAQQILDIVTRSIYIDGKISMPTTETLAITTGKNEWSYTDRTVTGSTAGSGDVPTYAIDSTLLGGMYAGRIRLIATEEGVGVRMLGEAKANTDDIILTSAGKVELQNAISAERDVTMTVTAYSLESDIYLNGANAKVSAKRDLTMTASDGNMNLSEGELYAGRNLAVAAGSLDDESALAGTPSSAVGTRFGVTSTSFNVAGRSNINGAIWGAGGSLSGTSGSLKIGSRGGVIYAGTTLGLMTSGNMSLAKAQVHSVGNMTLTSSEGSITTSSDDKQGIQTTEGNLNITSAFGLTNAGVITADAGTVTLRISDTINNSGSVYSHGALDVADQSNGSTQNITNSGLILSNDTLNIRAADISNTEGGTIQVKNGTTLSATNLTNAGKVLASTTTGHSATFTLSTFTNSGTVQSAEDISLSLSNILDNTEKILATRNLAINTASASATITNTGGSAVMQAGSTFTLVGTNAVFDTQSGTLLADTTNINLSRLNNSGTIQSEHGMSLIMGSGLTNSGTVLAKTTLTASMPSLSNSGSMQANDGMTVTATSLSNSGGMIASTETGHSGTFTLSTFTNSGTVQSAEDISLSLSNSLANTAKILATRNLAINTASTSTTITNTGESAIMQAGSTFTLVGTNAVFDTQSGTLLADTTNINLSRLNNSGTIQSEKSMSLRTGNTFTNSGTVLAKTTLTSSVTNLTNSGSIQADQGSTITVVESLSNTGTILASRSDAYNATLNVGTLSNTGSGIIKSLKSLTMNISGASVTNSSKILADDDVTLHATGSGLTLTNQSDGYIQSGSSTGNIVTIDGTSVILNNNAGGKILGDQLLLTLSSATNAGTIQGGSAASTMTLSGTVTNSGALSLATDSVGGGLLAADTIVNSSILQSQGNLNLNIATTLTNSGSVLAGRALTVRGTDSAYTITGAGRMQSGSLMSLKGMSGGNGLDITTSSGTVLYGNSMEMNVGTLTLADNAMVSTYGNMDIAANLLTLGGTTSRIVAAISGTGNATLTLANSLSNVGAIHSGQNMLISAPSITNTSTGGFSALNNLTLNASSGNFSNAGALYAGSGVTVTANSGTFTNVASTGTVDSGGSITISASRVINNNNMTATGNITLSAGTINNDTPSGDTRTWHETARSSDIHDSTNAYYSFPDNYEVQYWHKTWTMEQYYASGTPTKPQIVGGGTVTLNNFNTVTNVGGVIAGNTITISGNGGSTFTNNDLALQRQEYRQSWEIYTHYIALGPLMYDDHVRRNESTSHLDSTAFSLGAGVFANTLNGGGFSLVNAGSPTGASPNSRTASGASSSSLSGGVSGASGGESASGASSVGGVGTVSGTSSVSGVGTVSSVTSVSGVTTVSFGGLRITLPTNPNGYFVVNKSSSARYLVETNPLFMVGSNFVGSDYMEKRYGYNPDKIVKHLGDSNYEAYLVRQQLVSQIGSNSLKGYGSESDQMKRLMDQAVEQGQKSGWQYGKALTADQIANLKESVVWMVETVVAGEKVLAPVVYLSASERNAIETGAVIAAKDVKLELTSLTNTGGTISGSNTLDITSKGDIKNISGTIKGGDVSLTSTEGSIKNETFTQGSGDDKNYVTTVGKQAGIVATGNLNLDAAKDIVVKGGNVSAGKDASLSAKGEVTFDTVENKTTTTTHTTQLTGLFSAKTEETTTTTVNQVKSGLSSGGNLVIKSKNDITLAGTDVNVKGNASLDAGKNINVLARSNTKNVQTNSTESGLGVGGGLGGEEKISTTSSSGRNVGSNINIGGNATLNASKDITLEGAKVNVAGNGTLNAENVNVLAGKDFDITKTTKETKTFFKTSSDSDAGAGAGAGSQSKARDGAASASAGAGAGAEANASAGLAFAETTKTEKTSINVRSVGSTLNFGGNVDVNAKNSVTLKGSELSAGGDANVNAKDIKILAAENISVETTKTTKTSVGLMAESNNKAGAGASSGVAADSGGAGARRGDGAGGEVGADAGKLGANAEAGAEAKADSANKLALVRHSVITEEKLDITHTGSAIKSGGNTKLTAKNNLLVAGSSVEAKGDLDVSAKDMQFVAVHDVHETKKTSSVTSSGIYVDAEAMAGAKAKGNAGGGAMAAKGKASADARAEGSIGLYGTNTQNTSVEGSTTAVTSSLKAGGNITRTAQNTIFDQGTQIVAGGSVTQSAKEITSVAARNTTYSSSSTETNTAKLGAYAEANAHADAKAGGVAGIGGALGDESKADAYATTGYGVKAKYENQKGMKSSATSEAVVSTIKAGKNITSISSEKTSLEGTQLVATNNIDLQAKSLDYKAAANTETSSESQSSGSGELKVNMQNGGGGIKGGYNTDSKTQSSSTAVVGKLNAGGNLTVRTTGDARFEGTDLQSGKNTAISSGGNVTFDAARDTKSSQSSGFNVAVDASVDKKAGFGMGSVGGGYQESNKQSSKAVVSNIKSGGGLTIDAGNNASFEGTKIDAKGDAAISAKNNLTFNAARDTSSGSSLSVSAELSGTQSKSSSSTSTNTKAEVGFGMSQSESSNAVAGSINSGGNLRLSSGKDTTLEGTDVNAKGKTSVNVGGNLNVKEAQSTSTEWGVGVGVAGANKTKSGTDKEGKSIDSSTTDLKDASKNSASVSGSKSSIAKVGSLAGGAGLEINTAGDANFVGTKLSGGQGDVTIAAGGDVSFKAAQSSKIGGAVGGAFSGEGAVLNRADISGGVSNQVTNIESGGNVKVQSGGTIGLQGTQVKSQGAVNLSAAEGIVEQNAVGGGASLGLTKAGANVSDTKTKIEAKNGVQKNTSGVSSPIKAVVPIPANLPEGKKVEAKTADGKPLPSWVKFDPATGALSGTPPADFKGKLNIIVNVPQMDGTTKAIPVSW